MGEAGPKLSCDPMQRPVFTCFRFIVFHFVDQQETGTLWAEKQSHTLQDGWDDGEPQKQWPECFGPHDLVQAKDLV